MKSTRSHGGDGGGPGSEWSTFRRKQKISTLSGIEPRSAIWSVISAVLSELRRALPLYKEP
jgi:hypothetical protein